MCIRDRDLYFADIKPTAEVAQSGENEEVQETVDDMVGEFEAETLTPQESDPDGTFFHTGRV